MSLTDRLKRWFSREQPLSKGMYEYRSPPDAEERFRLHLRVEQDGTGILVINAAKVLHLNQTATEMAKLIIDERPAEDAARDIARRYRVRRAQARADYLDLQERNPGAGAARER